MSKIELRAIAAAAIAAHADKIVRVPFGVSKAKIDRNAAARAKRAAERARRNAKPANAS